MLKLENVSKTFSPGTVDEKKALCDVSLNVNDGDFITIIGSNGAGKSTLFNAICGDFFVDCGEIILDGENITRQMQHQRAKSIGRLYQDPMRGSAPGMSIEENLALAAGRGGWFGTISQADRRDFMDRLAQLDMGLENRLKQPVGLLSGGQRQALTLLMTTINPPKLLLLDEHTAALDPVTAEKVLTLTKQIVREYHLSCLMVTHNMQSALDIGNRTLMMNGGRILVDVEGEKRQSCTVEDLMQWFKTAVGAELQNDRMLLR